MPILNSKIRICKNIKLDKEYKHVLDYTEEQMLALCENKSNLVASSNTFSFIKSTGEIRVDFSYSTCLQANYMCFQNPNYSNKWFFAFIDSIEYVSEATTKINYTIDIWSTWFKYLTIKPCFTVREHVNDDTIGLHTINENLDIGNVYAQDVEFENNLKGSNWVAVLSSWNPATFKQFDGISVNAGTIFGKEVFLFNISNGYANLINFIRRCNEDSHIEDISDMFIVENTIALNSDLDYNVFAYPRESENLYQFATIRGSSESYAFEKNISKNYNFSNFTPKNNKCFCYPYNYLLVSNNCGNNNIYKYEDFNGDNASFIIEETVAIGGDCRLVPKNYQGQLKNIDESLPYGKLPVCGWSADSFTNWLTQNAINISSRIITDVALGFAVPEAGGSVASDVISLIGSFYKASLAPNIEKQGSNNGNVNLASEDNTFVFKKMRCKNEFMKQADDYFTMFGYKVNTLKTPNITGRKNFNYVEISQNDNIGYGNIPANDLANINKIFRRGVTIWHNHNNLGNYNVDNSIVS